MGKCDFYICYCWCSDKESDYQMQEMKETGLLFLGQKEALEQEMATQFSILAQNISWREEPGGLLSMGSERVRHD